MQSQNMRPVRIFVSYAHEDHAAKNELLRHLGWLRHDGSVDAFSDDQLKAGEAWDPALRKKLGDADIVIVLISAHFMDSAYCTTVELKAATNRLETGRVIPIVLDHCDWEALAISAVGMLPKDARNDLKPLVDWRGQRSRAWAGIAKAIRLLTESIQAEMPREAAAAAAPTAVALAAGRPPSAEARLAHRLSLVTPKELVSDLLDGHIDADGLDSVAADPALRRQAFMGLADSMARDSDAWMRLLLIDLCGRSRVNAEDIFDLSFDESRAWGLRSVSLPALRFMSDAIKREANQQLVEKAVRKDFDNLRITIEGLGFVGDLGQVRWIAEQEGVGKSSHATQKLAGCVAEAALNTHLHVEDRWPDDALDTLSEMQSALAARHQPEIHAFDFHRLMQVVRPGMAQALLRHVINRFNPSFAQGLLYALYGRCSPHAIAELIELAEAHPELARDAHRVLASIGTPRSVAVLDELSHGGRDGPVNAYALAIGWARADDRSEHLQRMLRDDDGTFQDGLWAAGELARSDPQPFAKLLHSATTMPNDSSARAMGWLGLAKTESPPARAELDAAFLHSTESIERIVLGIAGAFAQQRDLLQRGLHATQSTNAPVWQLWGHLHTDFRRACASRLGAPGALMVALLDRGDLS